MNRLVDMSALLVVLFGVSCTSGGGCSGQKQESSESSSESAKADELKSPSEFASLDSEKAKSRAMFEEMSQVLEHPRCVNCHPTGDEPLQGDQSRPHQPMVKRGQAGMGAAGMKCNNCHGNENYRNVPGKPAWRLAPETVGWDDLSTAEICELLTTPEQNGGKSVEEIVSFMVNNQFVAYGWNPPKQYEAAPGTHERFGSLAEAWQKTGAHCPESDDGQ